MITPSSGPAVSIPVALNVNSVAAPNLAAITNALSYATGSVAPGELVSLFGTGLGPTSPAGLMLTPSGTVSSMIADVRVLFDGIPAVLTLAWDKQVNAIVPYTVYGNRDTTVQLEYQGVKSAPMVVPLTPAAPGIASLDASGTGEGAILNQDTSLNSAANPAEVGSVVVFFATGAGQSSPFGIDAIIPGSTMFTPVLPVSVSIGGVNAPVLYAASAPGLVSGVLQVNAQIPVGLQPGAQHMLLKVGSVASQPGLTVLVK